MIAKVFEVMEMFQDLAGDSREIFESKNYNELYTLNGWIIWYVNYSSINLLYKENLNRLYLLKKLNS